MSRVIELNVGGEVYSTTEFTLRAHGESFFNSLLKGDFQQTRDSNGRLYIDRDGEVFKPILAWMRTGRLHFDPSVNAQAMLDEAEFYSLSGLVQELARINASVPVTAACLANLTLKAAAAWFTDETLKTINDILLMTASEGRESYASVYFGHNVVLMNDDGQLSWRAEDAVSVFDADRAHNVCPVDPNALCDALYNPKNDPFGARNGDESRLFEISPDGKSELPVHLEELVTEEGKLLVHLCHEPTLLPEGTQARFGGLVPCLTCASAGCQSRWYHNVREAPPLLQIPTYRQERASSLPTGFQRAANCEADFRKWAEVRKPFLGKILSHLELQYLRSVFVPQAFVVERGADALALTFSWHQAIQSYCA
ncbi:hypothetical protein CYMTET_34224 [Cymbomonas tetramitiformis]|uniref:BTB domain-containing protein n=1 Tax=Cymbomonas tetramitiformis TaxID=36881 RepID=A0AAE0KQ27_9CHLO|nr:hypothetical protein CYMTET_34224 [Cymbomonas tetramitiformis]|eukprot:gene7258-8645_t